MMLWEFLHQVYIPSRIEISDGQVAQIEVTIRQIERFAERPIALDGLTEDLIRRFMADFRRTRAAETTNNKRRHLLALWRCAYEEELLDRPPRARKVRKLRAPPKIPIAWTAAEFGIVLQAAKASTRPIAGLPSAAWWESLLLVMYDTGERRGAMLKTFTEDLDFADCSVIFRHTKTGRPRYCQLRQQTMEACRRFRDPNRELMWPWPKTPEALEKRFRVILKRSGVKFGARHGGLFHKIRRTSGTLVEANGGDGAKHLGNTRKVFEDHYRDPRFFRDDLQYLPRPE